MAWLIALALVWWIGSSLTNSYDRILYTKTKKRLNMENRVRAFLSHMYATAWYYYQPLEKQVAEQWIVEHSDYTVSDFAPTCQHYRTAGLELLQCDIYEIAIGQAFGCLRNYGISVCSRNFDYTSSDYGKGWTISTLPYQQNPGENCCDILKELPDLFAPYRWDMVSAITDADILELIPDQADSATRTYERPYYDGETWTLHREPREIARK